jgi:hypothetical protein
LENLLPPIPDVISPTTIAYPWAITRVEDRDAHLAALDRTSIDMDIKPFAQFVAEWPMEQKK